MIQVRVDGKTLETREGERVKYSKQVNDIADVSTVESNYTDGFKVPKTPNNVHIMEFLGLVGDGSTLPYRRVTAELLDDGVPLMRNGWLQVKPTTAKDYDLSIIDGIIDFFKAIENKKFGEDVDISALNHVKNVQTVIDSFTNEDYTYLVNDYGGQTNLMDEFLTPFNIDFLVPSARIKYLWNRMFETFGFTYSGSIFDSDDFQNAWLTFPKTNSQLILNTALEGEITELGGFSVWVPNVGQIERINLTGNYPWQELEIFPTDIGGSYLISQQNTNRIDKIIIQQTNNYQFTINLQGTADYRVRLFQNPNFTKLFEMPIKLRVFKNGSLVQQIISEMGEVVISQSAEAGDVYTFGVYALTTDEFWQYYNAEDPINPQEFGVVLPPENLNFTSFNLKIDQVEYEQTDFNDTFKDLDLKSFLKEVMWRFSLTPITNTETNHIEFLTSDEMIDKSKGVIDWSEKYAGRVKESYTIGSYAQLNYLRHKYNSENVDYADGVINVNNANLQDQRTILTSKIYSPELEVAYLVYGFGKVLSVKPTLVWQSEVELNDDDEPIVKYKGLTGRYYWLKKELVNDASVFASVQLGEAETALFFNKASTFETTFIDLVPKYQQGHIKLLDDIRIHEIELTLSVMDIYKIDFTRLYFFRQESQYYKLNKITFEYGKKAVGEFIRVKN